MSQQRPPFTPRSVANAISAVANTAIGKDWPLYATLLDHWRDIVGPDYAQSTLPVKISFPKGKPPEEAWFQGKRTDGVLHIRIPKGLALSFTYLSEQIKERITASFGYPAIERIVFEPDFSPPQEKKPAPPPEEIATAEKAEIENGTKDIDNNELREVLQKFGESVMIHG